MSYAVHWSAAPNPDGLNVSVFLADEPRTRAASQAALLASVVNYAALGARGGLGGGLYSPRVSNVQLLSSRLTSPLGLEWRMRASNVANRQALLSSLEFMSDQIATLRAVQIEAPPGWGREATPGATDAYPGLSFAVQDERSHESAGFVVEVTFTSAHEDAVLQQVEDAYGDWFTAANTGAFSSPAVPPNISRLFPLGETSYRNDSLIMRLEEASVTEPEATNCLLNVLEWASARIAPIARVEFYE